MMLPFISMNLPPSRTVVLHSGMRIDLADYPRDLLLSDMMRRLSHASADLSFVGFYSLAQRAAIVGEQLGRSDGALTGLHAVALFLPFAFIGYAEPELLWAMDCAPVNWGAPFRRLVDAATRALGIERPMSPDSGAAIGKAIPRLRLAELRCGRRGVGPEIAALEADGLVPLVPKINPLPSEVAFERLEHVVVELARQANIPRSTAWKGLRP